MRDTLFIVGRRCIHSVFVLLATLLLLGCVPKAKLVGQYDEIIDKSVHQLEARTVAHIQKVIDNQGEGKGSFEANRQFYAEVAGEVQALTVRAQVIEEGLKRTPLTDNFVELNEQYTDLSKLHKLSYSKPVMQSSQEALDQSFRAIVKHMIYMKWNQD